MISQAKYKIYAPL